MNRVFKRIIAAVLVLTIGIGIAVQAFAAEGNVDISVVSTYEEVGKNLTSGKIVPTIIIHGISQIDTFITDEEGNPLLNGDGDQITGWPITVDIPELVTGILMPLVLTLITQKDYASEAGYKAACKALKYNSCKTDGSPTYPTYVDRQYCSVADMDEEHKDIVYGAVPFQDVAKKIGENNLYFFSYNSSGDVTEIAKELNDYIEMVKKQTGAEDVNLAPISMGGTIATAWLEMYSGRYTLYKENYSSVHKIVFVIAALNGSDIVGDLMTDNTLLNDDEWLYKKLLPALIGEDDWTSYLINLCLRILPADVLKSVLDSVLDGAKDTLVGNCTIMWALIPSSYYDKAYELYFADKASSEYDTLKTKLNFYHKAQTNLRSNINDFMKQGGIVHAICSYGLQLYTIGKTSLTVNSDTIIQSSSTSLQATFADLGKTLPVDYKAKNPVCTNPEHNHISPDGCVDASTSYIPENVWFVEGLNHEHTSRSDSVINFAGVLLADDTIVDVHSDPENYPQFNGSRTTKDLRNNYIPKAYEVLEKGDITAEQKKELEEAISDCEAMLKETVVDTKKSSERIDRLYNALVDVGVYSPKNVQSTSDKILLAVFKFLSDKAYEKLGTKGYSEIFK